ncbi:MAG: aspartate carbamoyltransferase regulatory subunit, partial [Clostridium sp.]|nr:aspartate carbamoyltransferase regulatory subunit [Clostridium sp.]
MLEITSIKNGLVIDHIKAGMGIKIFNYLNLDRVNSQVALIMNVESDKVGKKD